eukprot:144471-Prorocentrum_minimum.AAC.4
MEGRLTGGKRRFEVVHMLQQRLGGGRPIWELRKTLDGQNVYGDAKRISFTLPPRIVHAQQRFTYHAKSIL